MDPDYDLSVAYPGFLKLHGDKLSMPTEKGSDFGIFDALTDEYRKAAVEFYKVRQDLYTSHNYAGLGCESIWKGAVASDLAYLRIRQKNGRDIVGSIVVNRWHDNVAYLFGESGALDATQDSADFIPGLIGSYPNYFFDVREEDLSDFIDLLAHFEKGPRDAGRLSRYGVNRAEDRLWDAYDWFQQRFFEDEPVDGGLFDLNRYYHDAR